MTLLCDSKQAALSHIKIQSRTNLRVEIIQLLALLSVNLFSSGHPAVILGQVLSFDRSKMIKYQIIGILTIIGNSNYCTEQVLRTADTQVPMFWDPLSTSVNNRLIVTDSSDPFVSLTPFSNCFVFIGVMVDYPGNTGPEGGTLPG